MRTPHRLPQVNANGRQRRHSTSQRAYYSVPRRLLPRSPRSPSPTLRATNPDENNNTPGNGTPDPNDHDSECGPPLSFAVKDGYNEDHILSPLISQKYWKKKGLILGRCVEMWDTFTQIITQGVSRDPELDEDFMHTEFENRQYKKFLLLVEVAPAMITVLQGVNPQSGPAVSMELDKVIDAGRKQAHRADVNGIRGAIGQWPGIEWDPPFPIVRHLLGFHHPTSGRFLCPITLDWDNESVREGLRHGTQVVTATDHPNFLWPPSSFDMSDVYKGFLRGPLLITAYKHVFISPSSAKEADRSTRGGNATLHDITFVTYESIAYVATVTRFALSNELSFVLGGSDTDMGQRSGFPYRSFYRELLDHKELMSENELISLIRWWNEKIFPCTIYTNGAVRTDSAGAIMREQARGKRAGMRACAAAQPPVEAEVSPSA